MDLKTQSKPSSDKKERRGQLERYRLLVENIEDYAIFLLDTKGYVASWNLGAQKFKGYTPHEILGKHFSIFFTPKDIKSKRPEWELVQSKAVGRVVSEGWRVRKDGTRFWANVVITALFNEHGEHLGFAKVTRDLTERKHYEDSLYGANVKLAHSYKELQKLNAAKDEFVSLASHQLRTPATGVKQYLALLIDGYAGPVSERQLDFLQKAYDSNDRQIEIVNDLLHVAQLDAGKVVLNSTHIDVKDLIEDVIDEQAEAFKIRRQKISLDMPKGEVIALVDPVRFRMVMENLIDNASKYTPLGGGISVSITRHGYLLTVSVTDNGIGIAKKDLPKLFEKFTRISNSLTKDIAGSGLGLYWVDKIVRLHGGKIEVKSTPNKGTTFSVVLPRKYENE